MKSSISSLSTCGALCAAIFAGSAAADIVPIFSDPANSEYGIGEFSGSIEYTAGIGTGTLVITLTNDSSPLNGGFLTGFAFNVDSADAAASATLISSNHPAMTGFQNQEASPFGTYDAGAATGGNWQSGMGPSGGIAVGATGTFVFTVSATDAALLTASHFIETGPNEFNFVARFHGFLDGGSDKVPGRVPGPGSVALLLAGCLIGVRRRRKS